jgi:hypothetical protein
MPISGKSLGNPEFDTVWDTAQDTDIAVGLHLVVIARISGTSGIVIAIPGLCS